MQQHSAEQYNIDRAGCHSAECHGANIESPNITNVQTGAYMAATATASSENTLAYFFVLRPQVLGEIRHQHRRHCQQ